MSGTSSVTPERVLRQFLEATQEGFWHIGIDGVTVDANPAMCEILGRPREEILGRSIYDFVDEANSRIFDRQLELRRRGIVGPYEIALQRPDGSNVSCINNATPAYDENGVRVSSIGLWTEITELKSRHADLIETSRAAQKTAAEAKLVQATLEQRARARTVELEHANEALRTSQEQYRLLTELSPDAVFVHVGGRIVFANPTMVALMEANSEDQLIGMEAIDVIHPDSREHIRKRRVEVSQSGKLDFEDLCYRNIAGKTIDVDASASLTTWSGQEGVLIVARDVTERKHMERRLIQAQKMEAVGQLTGGVAHDFNNLLAVIQGNTENLADEVGKNHKIVQSILRAAKRGAELTQRLLAFSRQQPLQPKPVDLAELIAGLQDLLDRTLGEEVEIAVVAEDGLWQAMADPGQVENALLNLAINARDAMPEGGKLTIECRNVTLDGTQAAMAAEVSVGLYVMLAVTDTGAGMSAEVQSHAFEPFFTTKDVGKGSGLGLSMVYGFAKQSGGHATIESAHGAGTTIKLYLPIADAVPATQKAAAHMESLRGSGERVLGIEDDAEVRDLAVQVLQTLGYQVNAVPTALPGLDLLKREPYDVVLSDIILPGGMSGRKFAEAARLNHPGVKIVFMSGYPPDTAWPDGFESSDWVLLNKPFQRSQLANAIRDAIGS
jgi:PAS domain S-box-containing protein